MSITIIGTPENIYLPETRELIDTIQKYNSLFNITVNVLIVGMSIIPEYAEKYSHIYKNDIVVLNVNNELVDI